MNLGVDFIIGASIIIFALLPLYIYREKIFKFIYKKGDIKTFLKDLDFHLREIYPYVNFRKINLEDDDTTEESTQKIIYIEKYLNQYLNKEYEKRTQKCISKDLLWQSYEIDSTPKKGHAPKDLAKRKDFVLKRDNNRCNRCGKYIKMDTSALTFIKELEDGGTYHFENLTVLCNDCNRVIKSQNPSNILKDLHIYDELLKRYIH